jgi:putative PIN family toxin of toxin-antitoxin system
MRVLLDTNVLVAALIAHGTCHEILEHCVQEHEIIASSFLLEELRRVLTGKLGYARREAAEAERLLKSRLTIVSPHPLDTPTCRDSDDDTILGTALAGACRCIVTGDKDLLVLKRYKGIDIVEPNEFWRYE